MCGLDVPHERVQTVKGDWTFEPGRIENGGTMKVAFWALLKGLTRPIKAVYCTALLLWFHTRPHDARLFFSESQFKSFSALTAFDNLTSSNIRPLLRNLLFFCSSWNWYSPLTLYISSVTGNRLHPRTLLMCFLPLTPGCFWRAWRGHWYQKPRRDLHSGSTVVAQGAFVLCRTFNLVESCVSQWHDTLSVC